MEHENTENYFPNSNKDEDEKRKRKQRAIGLLADRILKELPYAPERDTHGVECESWEMTVDQIGKKLEARVGSVYEVFHVFESLLLATKIGPKTYRWNGFAQMRPTLSFLQYIGIYCLDLPKEMEEVQNIEIDALLYRSHKERIEKKIVETIEPSSVTPSLWPGIGDLIGEELSSVVPSQLQKNYLEHVSVELGNDGDAMDHQDTKTSNDKPKWRKLKKDPEYMINDKTPHILQVIQKFIMLFLVPSRIHNKTRKALSLAFAAKVIHGVQTLPEEVLLTRTRRLYDISNILLSISRHCDVIAKEMPFLGLKGGEDLFAMKKVRLPNGNSVRRTTIQYEGPDVEPCQITDIMHLPDYRREYLFFSAGKAQLGIPERPKFIPRTTTLRLCPVEGGDPQAIDCEGLHLSRMAVIDLKTPISHEDIIYLESARRNVSLPIKENVDSIRTNMAEIDPNDLWLAIMPGQQFVKECFNDGIVQ